MLLGQWPQTPPSRSRTTPSLTSSTSMAVPSIANAGANSGAAVYPVDVATLNGAVVASRVRVRFASDGKAHLEPEAAGVEGALGRIVAAVFVAMGEEGWARLKTCDSQTCRWVFYDSSRNHSSRWCKMASCGNREKARRFRERSKAN